MDDRIYLNEGALEREVGAVFERLGAQSRVPPPGAWDVELFFSTPFFRKLNSGEEVPFQISAEIVVEAKSRTNPRRGADLEMCRQLKDWVSEHWLTQKGFSPPEQIVATPKRAINECHNNLMDALDNSEKLDQLKSQMRFRPSSRQSFFWPIQNAVESTAEMFAKRPKGVLVLNHQAQQKASERLDNPFHPNVEQWARQNGLAVITWLNLLAIEDAVRADSLDPFNALCALLATDGIVQFPIRYNWMDHCDFYTPLLFHERPNSSFPQKRPWFLQEAS